MKFTRKWRLIFWIRRIAEIHSQITRLLQHWKIKVWETHFILTRLWENGNRWIFLLLFLTYLVFFVSDNQQVFSFFSWIFSVLQNRIVTNMRFDPEYLDFYYKSSVKIYYCCNLHTIKISCWLSEVVIKKRRKMIKWNEKDYTMS